MDGLGSVIQSELRQKERKIPYANTYIWNLKKSGSEEPRVRTGIKTHT